MSSKALVFLDEPKPGAVRYKASDGELVITNPHDRLYSSALFAADEVFTGNGWEPIVNVHGA